jgi:cytidylate kinase
LAIISLHSGSFTGARELAQRVSDDLAYRFVSREDIVDRTAQYGVSRERRERARRRHLGMLRPMDLEWAHYLVYKRAALSKEVRHGNLVYLGENGQELLRDFPNVLNVRVVADMELRVENLMGRTAYVMTRKKATRIIERMEEKRMRWQRTLFDGGWREGEADDLVIESGRVGVPEACRLIREAVERPQYKTTARSLEAIELLAVAAELRARIAMDEAVADDSVEVGVRGGVIVLSGSVPTAEGLHVIRELLD